VLVSRYDFNAITRCTHFRSCGPSVTSALHLLLASVPYASARRISRAPASSARSSDRAAITPAARFAPPRPNRPQGSQAQMAASRCASGRTGAGPGEPPGDILRCRCAKPVFAPNFINDLREVLGKIRNIALAGDYAFAERDAGFHRHREGIVRGDPENKRATRARCSGRTQTSAPAGEDRTNKGQLDRRPVWSESDPIQILYRSQLRAVEIHFSAPSKRPSTIATNAKPT
jgi:hypothetical protein